MKKHATTVAVIWHGNRQTTKSKVVIWTAVAWLADSNSNTASRGYDLILMRAYSLA
jgi:hypothetical protein